MSLFANLAQGIVIENTLESWTGALAYSDTEYPQDFKFYPLYAFSDHVASIPLIGIVAGVTRVALCAIHIAAHTLALVITFDSRHFAHIAKGGCELLKGIIQSVPIVGHLFARAWIYEWKGSWWMIKIYNPYQPDSLDDFSRNHDPKQRYWAGLKASRPSAYIRS